MSEYKKYRKKVYCRTCKVDTNHQILKIHTVHEDIDESFNFYTTEDYMICQCMGCETVNFVQEYDDPNMHFYHPEEKEWIDIEDIKVYPPKPLTDKYVNYPIKDYDHLPKLLKTLYQQVVANFEMKHYLLAAAGLRMIIEGLCNELSIEEGFLIDEVTGGKVLNKKTGDPVIRKNLEGRINGLSEAGVLTSTSSKVLHIIRNLGNQTVHELKDPKRSVILSGLEIVEHTFYNVYELKKYDVLSKKYSKKP
ncbi:DUF4145 domain-containing protein [Priestia megaterium]|uniref:DUF4145 domain-containing protein n=1 Tax=Priestia megaterium TaxID=1404 RepID=UPI00263A9ABB|nr:DUF4145 domain-containing protein [Priestia megaterium]MDN4866242.1 DUF4145 domain-containing protein [Priestia megaterium]